MSATTPTDVKEVPSHLRSVASRGALDSKTDGDGDGESTLRTPSYYPPPPPRQSRHLISNFNPNNNVNNGNSNNNNNDRYHPSDNHHNNDHYTTATSTTNNNTVELYRPTSLRYYRNYSSSSSAIPSEPQYTFFKGFLYITHCSLFLISIAIVTVSAVEKKRYESFYKVVLGDNHGIQRTFTLMTIAASFLIVIPILFFICFVVVPYVYYWRARRRVEQGLCRWIEADLRKYDAEGEGGEEEEGKEEEKKKKRKRGATKTNEGTCRSVSLCCSPSFPFPTTQEQATIPREEAAAVVDDDNEDDGYGDRPVMAIPSPPQYTDTAHTLGIKKHSTDRDGVKGESLELDGSSVQCSPIHYHLVPTAALHRGTTRTDSLSNEGSGSYKHSGRVSSDGWTSTMLKEKNPLSQTGSPFSYALTNTASSLGTTVNTPFQGSFPLPGELGPRREDTMIVNSLDGSSVLVRYEMSRTSSNGRVDLEEEEKEKAVHATTTTTTTTTTAAAAPPSPSVNNSKKRSCSNSSELSDNDLLSDPSTASFLPVPPLHGTGRERWWVLQHRAILAQLQHRRTRSESPNEKYFLPLPQLLSSPLYTYLHVLYLLFSNLTVLVVVFLVVFGALSTSLARLSADVTLEEGWNDLFYYGGPQLVNPHSFTIPNHTPLIWANNDIIVKENNNSSGDDRKRNGPEYNIEPELNEQLCALQLKGHCSGGAVLCNAESYATPMAAYAALCPYCGEAVQRETISTFTTPCATRYTLSDAFPTAYFTLSGFACLIVLINIVLLSFLCHKQMIFPFSYRRYVQQLHYSMKGDLGQQGKGPAPEAIPLSIHTGI